MFIMKNIALDKVPMEKFSKVKKLRQRFQLEIKNKCSYQINRL